MLAVELLTPPGGMGRGQHRPGDGTQDSDDVVTAEQQVLIVGRLPVAGEVDGEGEGIEQVGLRQPGDTGGVEVRECRQGRRRCAD